MCPARKLKKDSDIKNMPIGKNQEEKKTVDAGVGEVKEVEEIEMVENVEMVKDQGEEDVRGTDLL